MIKDNIILYILELVLVFFLLSTLIFPRFFSKIIIAIILIILLFVIQKVIKIDKLKELYKRSVTFSLIIICLIYIACIYVCGIYIGFYEATFKLNFTNLKNIVIPHILIFVAIENIRKIFLLKEQKITPIILLLINLLLDIALTTNIMNVSGVKSYFNLVSCVIFPSIAFNLLYNYIIVKYRNCRAIIIFRSIINLYIYFFPIIPNFDVLFEAIIKIILPFIVFIVLELFYSKEKKKEIPISSKSRDIIIVTILAIIASTLVMLISCKFKYGMLVVASGSMTGALNKGDAIIYGTEFQDIDVGEIIVFKDGSRKVVHRVIDKKQSNGNIKYYTKGDANDNMDKEFREEKDIIGKVKLRLPYFGMLSVMIMDAFN